MRKPLFPELPLSRVAAVRHASAEAITWRVLRRCPECGLRRRRHDPLDRAAHKMSCDFPYRQRKRRGGLG